MATATKTWSFTSDADGWTAVPAGSMVMAWESSDGSPAAGCLQNRLAGKNQNPGQCYWYIQGTWESLFGIAAGSTVTEVGTSPNADYNRRCCEYDTVITADSGPFEFYNSVPQLQGTFSAAYSYAAADGWATEDGSAIAVPGAMQPSSTTIHLRLNVTLRTGNSSSAVVNIRQDQVVLTITYTTGAAEVFFENRHPIGQGMKPQTAAGMGGVLIE